VACEDTPRPVIRRATRDDLANLVHVARESFFATYGTLDDPLDVRAYAERHFTAEAFGAVLDDSSAHLAVLLDAGAIAGYALLVESAAPNGVTGNRPVELSRLYLLADRIGRGHGAALLAHALDWAAASGFDTLWLGVYDRNERAMAFYRRFGFEVVGTRPFDWHGVIYHDPVMARSVRG
jgi:ribosomal protein S18 acetylase RimI-like enzyme